MPAADPAAIANPAKHPRYCCGLPGAICAPLPQHLRHGCLLGQTVQDCEMAACPQCKEFLEGKSFVKPREYLEFALSLVELVKNGALALNESTCKLEDLFNPDWPGDIVEHNLQCVSCGRKFQLFADTFRGHAGWGLTGPPTNVPELEEAASS
jgi:hypothetical protein